MSILFLFLDGVGLGPNDPTTNPFATAYMPHLGALLGGKPLVVTSAPFTGPRATLHALDACLGVNGLPQSATGQATLLTGVNVPSALGYHYGPKPNPETAAFLQDGGLFGQLTRAGKTASLLNAYPDGYFQAVNSGRRLYSAIPLAVTRAGLALRTAADLQAENAISADFTAQGWRERLNHLEIPALAPALAGQRLAALARAVDFSFFEYWLTDYAGHEQNSEQAIALLEQFDLVLGGLLDDWNDETDLILLTSDHGNLEDLSTRRHTANPVPLLLVGPPTVRRVFDSAHNLTDLAPRIASLLLNS